MGIMSACWPGQCAIAAELRLAAVAAEIGIRKMNKHNSPMTWRVGDSEDDTSMAWHKHRMRQRMIEGGMAFTDLACVEHRYLDCVGRQRLAIQAQRTWLGLGRVVILDTFGALVVIRLS